MKHLIIWFSAAILFMQACRTSQPAATGLQNASVAENYSLNGKIFTSLYQQKAAEYRALCYQAYNAARQRVLTYQKQTNKPLAIITDIDETILNNSPYAVKQGLMGKEYDLESWHAWTALGKADTLPGAGSLLHWLAARNIEVFYITNRDEVERAGTLANLKLFGLPYADNEHLILRQKESSKEQRRNAVLDKYEVVFYMGDNLGDFSQLFDKKSFDQRQQNTDISAADFGQKFIVLPNPNYGDWEGAIYNYNYRYTQQQKDSVMRAVLKTY